MLFSYKLLSKLVDLEGISVEELVNKLTFSGFEVESYKPLAQGSKLVVGKVLSCLNHPDSDHLHLLKVDIGSDVLDIVCGAKNVREGIKVCLALVGCYLPALDVTLKKSVIRGYPSSGMCCSLTELGIDKFVQSEEEQNGIVVLNDDAEIGSDPIVALGLDDYVIDISILANRPDCLSHIGLAREISALFNREMKPIKEYGINKVNSLVKVNSLTSSCKKFELVEIKGDFKNMKTPASIVNYLRAVNIRSISYIVDIGNFSMSLTGQPLHMYDLDKIPTSELIVKDDFEGKFTALDQKEYEIKKGDIVISSNNVPCCLGGIMGAYFCRVDENSTHIGIEAANFSHKAIRQTSSRLGLASDSSSLFARGVNPYLTQEALNVTLSLFEGSNFKIVGSSVFDCMEEFKGSYPFSLQRLNHRLGTSFTKEDINKVFDAFKLTHTDTAVDRNVYRLDLNEQCDIEEEVFRFYQDRNIPLSLDSLPITEGGYSPRQKKVLKVRQTLIEAGLDQIFTYTLLDKENDNSFRIFDKNHEIESYVLAHPLTEYHMYIRSDILSSLIATIRSNFAYKHDDLALFEISEVDAKKDGKPLAKTYLSIGLTNFIDEQGMLKREKADFFVIKGLFERVLQVLNIDPKRVSYVFTSNHNFHSYKAVDIYIGKDLIGTMGELHPKHKLKNAVVGEFDLSYLLEMKSPRLRLEEKSSYLPIRRDLSFVLLDPQIRCEQMIKEIKRAGGKIVSDVQIFDTFKKDGMVSYAFALKLLNPDKTMTDDEINAILDKIISSVTSKMKVELRK